VSLPAPRRSIVSRRSAASRALVPSSPYDAQAAVEHLLARLRAAAGATRVSVWLHEASTDLLVPFGRAVSGSDAADDESAFPAALPRSASLLLSAVLRTCRPVVARSDGRRGYDRELAERGLRSAHAEPLIRDGEVIGVLTVEPAAAAIPHLLRQTAPKLALALAEAGTRRSEQRRSARSEVLLGLIEFAATSQSTDHLLRGACRQLAELGEVERACVFLVEDGRLVPRMAGYADGRDDVAAQESFRRAPVPLPLAEAVVRTGEPAAADRDSPLLSGWWQDSFSIASAFAVPLGRSPHIAGVLILVSRHPRPFPEDVRRLSAAAGAHLGGVLQQAQTRRADAASLNTAQVVRRLFVDGAGATGVAEVSGCRSMTTAPATPRCPTCAPCPSTNSSSTAASSAR
jgi:GAF domain-containing protein